MKLYRFFDYWKSEYKDFEGWIEVADISLEVLKTVRETDKCWYVEWEGKEKRILKGNGKRFAHEKIEWAMYSFKKRKRHQRNLLDRMLRRVEGVLAIADDAYPTEP